jgi:hypothetical protein
LNGGPGVEIWNFSVPGHAPGQRWEDFVRTGWETTPDLVIYEATPADAGWDERRLRGLLPRGIGWNAPQYHAALRLAKVRPGGDSETYKHALRSHRRAILAGVYGTIAAECRSHRVPSVWILVPRVGKPADPAARAELVHLAERAGFSAVFDLSDVFDGLDPNRVVIASDDYHPNVLGHARLARRLESVLLARPDLLRLGRSPRVEGGDP